MRDIRAEMMEFPSDDHSTPGYLARPAAPDWFPGLVVIQEWWGLVPHIKEVAERFAAEGYVALAPDLYYGETAEEPDEARKLAMALDRERVFKEMAAAVKYLQRQDYVRPKKIGLVGWCMGGGLALSASAQVADVGAVVVFYGRPLEAGDTKMITCPVLGLYGEEDQGIPVSLVQEFEQELQRNDISHEIHTYAGAGHAFFNDTRPHAYHPQAAEDAWTRTLTWFERYLV